MKILLVNAPFITFNNKFLNIEKEILKDKIHKTINYLFDYNIPKSIENIFNLKKSKTTTGFRYGVRAGSRWPWTSDRPHGDAPYPFMLGYSASLLKENGFEVERYNADWDRYGKSAGPKRNRKNEKRRIYCKYSSWPAY